MYVSDIFASIDRSGIIPQRQKNHFRAIEIAVQYRIVSLGGHRGGQKTDSNSITKQLPIRPPCLSNPKHNIKYALSLDSLSLSLSLFYCCLALPYVLERLPESTALWQALGSLTSTRGIIELYTL